MTVSCAKYLGVIAFDSYVDSGLDRSKGVTSRFARSELPSAARPNDWDSINVVVAYECCSKGV
jgi:hypothetical protein